MVLLFAACRSTGSAPRPIATESPASSPTSVVRDSPPPAAQAKPTLLAPAERLPSPVVSVSPVSCGYRPAAALAELREDELREASGLVASQQSPGVYWALNDSGNAPRIYAFDAQGQALATVRLDGATNEDWEALAVGPGRDGGQALYVADTGDNRGTRRESIIYRIAEPLIAPGQNRAALTRAPAERIRFSYSGRSSDVEALLIHPRTGEIVLVSKEYAGRATVFRLRQTTGSERAELEEVGALNLSSLGPLVSAVTDAAVAPDGGRVALRTYNAVVEFELPAGAELASLWRLQPRIYPLSDSPQGEGITYRADGRALLTIGEQRPAVLFQLEWQC
jgi:hypothetical protein